MGQGAGMGQGARMGETHAWGKAHARGRRWSNGLTTGGESVGRRLQAGDESLQWFIHAGLSVWWTIRKWVKQPYTKVFTFCTRSHE